MPPTAALVRNVAREALAPFLPGDASSLELEDIALGFALHAPHIDCVLAGMRSVAYVEHVASHLRLADGEEARARAALSAEAHAALAQAMRRLVEELH